MSPLFRWAFQCLMRHEGGFVNHRSDPGGPTNYGISLRYLVSRGDLDGDGLLDGDLDGDGDIDIDDIRSMTEDQAQALYHDGFWGKNLLGRVQGELLPLKIFDMAVNMGSGRAWKLTQQALNEFGAGLTTDGVVGPLTLQAVNSRHRYDYDILMAVRGRQRDFYDRLVANNPELQAFYVGWMRRAAA